LYNRLTEYVNNKILNSQQYGFRKNLATEDAIFKLTQGILTVLNSKKNGRHYFLWFGKSL
jgi:hypothetical protein